MIQEALDGIGFCLISVTDVKTQFILFGIYPQLDMAFIAVGYFFEAAKSACTRSPSLPGR